MTLWIAAGGLIALTLAVLLVALLRARPPSALRGDYDLAVYRSQLEEVERDVERGILAPDLAEAARLEIKRRMLAAAGGNPAIDEVAREATARLSRVAKALAGQ